MKNIILALSVFTAYQLSAQNVYEIDAAVATPSFRSDHLKLGGKAPNGGSISVNNYYLSLDGKPNIPVTGEFHFTRYPNQYWDESIKKMKAGGITVIPTYVFWNLHEEEEGKFIWTGDKNLRLFIEQCKKNNVYSIVRIGPFCHGEIRNGGLPDWLLGKPLNIRMNDPLYLSYVEKLYTQIAEQLKGLYYKDGGPIIGIQLENEYQHSAAPWGLTYPGQPLDMTASERDRAATHEGVAVASGENPFAAYGADHMKVLKTIAEKAGIIAPLYTATGWGYAAIVPNETIPVTAAYAYPFWTPRRDYSPFFLYKNMHSNPDYSPVRYKAEDYPAFPAELGSGINLVYTRRPVAVHQSFDAMVNRCLGSGANGVGYYMFHGGSTPKGKHNFMNDEAYGMTKISYEYQGPIGEFGQVREGFHRMKLIHFFLKDFSEILAPMTVALPPNAEKLTPENISDLRYSVRINGERGFLFLNNFQDDTTMLDQKNIQVKIRTSKGQISVPEQGGFDLKSGENLILPFNFDINGTHLNYATAQLMMKGDDSNPYFVFFSPEGTKAEFSFPKGTRIEQKKDISVVASKQSVLVKADANISEFVIINKTRRTRVLVIDKKTALTGYVANIGGQKSILLSNAVILQNKDGLEFISNGDTSLTLAIYPRPAVVPKISLGNISALQSTELFQSFKITLPSFDFKPGFKEISSRKILVPLPHAWPAGVSDVIMNVNYIGDTGMGFINGDLVADNFYNGTGWQIGLRKFMAGATKPNEMVLYFRPMNKDASYLLDLSAFPESIPDFANKSDYLKIKNVSFTTQYKTTIRF